MATRLNVQLELDLLITRSSAANSCAGADVGGGIRAQAHDDSRSAELQLGQQLAEVNSPASFVVLTPAATTIQGSLFVLHVLEGGPLDVRLTHATQGQTVYPAKGVLAIEPSDDELITAVAVQGEGTFTWSLTGDAA
jgi:hypothetical protein